MFIEQAYKGDNSAWKTILTIILTSGIFVVNVLAFFMIPQSEADAMYDELKDMPKLTTMAISLLPFVGLLILLFFLVAVLHGRSVKTLTTSRPKVDFGRVLFAFGIVVIVTVLSFGVSYFSDPSGVVWNFHPMKFAVLLLLSLLLFPMQIAFEEYLFRGYLMQQIGIATASRFVPLLVTSAVFGFFHGANPEVHELGWGIMVFYIGTGFLLGIMTLMDEGIELSLGYHLGNNLMAVLLVTSDYSAIQSDALFKLTTKADTQGTTAEMVFSMCIVYPLVILIFAKKYKWNGWRQKLFGKVAPAPSLTKTLDHHEYDPNL